MRGILIRLAQSDSEAAAALKIITFFDELTAQRGLDPAGLVVAASALAECPVGIQLVSGEQAHSGSQSDSTAAPDDSLVRSSRGHAVWLEREGDPEPTDELILERCAVALDVISERAPLATDVSPLGDPEALQTLLSADRPDGARRAAADQLRLAPSQTLRVVALDLRDAGDRIAATLTLLARARTSVRPVNVGGRDGLGVALVPERSSSRLDEELRGALATRYGSGDSPVRCGISSMVKLEDSARAWAEATAALKFSLHGAPEQAVTAYESLGVVSLLADAPSRRLKDHPDVSALVTLGQTPNGASDLKVLDVFCHAGSLRSAAQSLHLHHSSVAARLAHIEQVLDWPLDSPEGRFRARMAILATRIVSHL